MSFAEECLKPVHANLAPNGNGIGIELEPFDLEYDGGSETQEEPVLEFSGFQLPTTKLSDLKGRQFLFEASREGCEGSLFLSVNSMGEHYWVDLLAIEFGDLIGEGLETEYRIRFSEMPFECLSKSECTLRTITKKFSYDG